MAVRVLGLRDATGDLPRWVGAVGGRGGVLGIFRRAPVRSLVDILEKVLDIGVHKSWAGGRDKEQGNVLLSLNAIFWYRGIIKPDFFYRHCNFYLY